MRSLSLLTLVALLSMPQTVFASPATKSKAAWGAKLRLRLSLTGRRRVRLLPAPAKTPRAAQRAKVQQARDAGKAVTFSAKATAKPQNTKSTNNKSTNNKSSGGIWFKDTKGKLSQLDKAAAEKLFGIKWTRKQTLGMNAKDLPGYTDGVGFNFDADGEIVDPPVHKQYKPNLAELKAIAGKTAPIYVQKVSEKIGYGLFARGVIKKGTPVGEYAGVVRRGNDKADRLNAYTFVYDPWNHFKMVVDAEKSGNYMRFANHSAKNPNMEAKLVYREKSRRWHVLLVAKKDIKKGDQLLFNYSNGYDWSRFGINNPAEL